MGDENQQQSAGRTAAEIGSPEFQEDRTQINSLNNKWIFAKEVFSQDRLAREEVQLFNAAFDALLENNALAKKLNAKFFEGVDDRAESSNALRAQARRHADDNAYVTRYDLSNPVTTGTGDAVRAAAYTPNRATDVAAAGQGVNAEAITTALAKQMDATITPVLATLQQMIQALTTATTSIANVVNQAQPKTAA